ncbi:MAG: hypothetical protein HYX38_19440 [Rhodospirillales bacterium]|nr:hypothetical protein [Rhodospirillales bacterium]
MTPRSSGVGSWIVLAVLVLLLVLAIVFLVVGWETTEADSRQAMSTGGYVAMVLGIVATLALGVGLMALVFYSSRKGRD